MEEKKAWKELMLAINNMGSLSTEEFNYKNYHKKWDTLADKARIYQRTASLKEKYGLNEEV